MKPTFAALILAALLGAACSTGQDKSPAQGEGTHTHEDGTVHPDHDAGEPAQEEFSVPADTLSGSTPAPKEHTHEGHDHPHTH